MISSTTPVMTSLSTANRAELTLDTDTTRVSGVDNRFGDRHIRFEVVGLVVLSRAARVNHDAGEPVIYCTDAIFQGATVVQVQSRSHVDVAL